MPSITIPKQPFVDDGVLITYIGTPLTCTYWEVVGVVSEVEGSPIGSLLHSIIVADANGRAVNQYKVSTTNANAGKIERIKVSESA